MTWPHDSRGDIGNDGKGNGFLCAYMQHDDFRCQLDNGISGRSATSSKMKCSFLFVKPEFHLSEDLFQGK